MLCKCTDLKKSKLDVFISTGKDHHVVSIHLVGVCCTHPGSPRELYRSISNADVEQSDQNMCCSENSQDLYRNIYIVNIQAISIIWLMLGWIWRPHQNGSCVHLQQVINNCSLINIIKCITMIELNVKMKKRF